MAVHDANTQAQSTAGEQRHGGQGRRRPGIATRLKRAASISRRIAVQMKHNAVALAVIILMPALIGVIAGGSFRFDYTGVRIIVINLDQGYNGTNLGNDLIDNLDREYFDIVAGDNLDDAMGELKRGEARAVLFLSTEFTKEIFRRFNMTDEQTHSAFFYRLVIDSSHPSLEASIVYNVNVAAQRTIGQYTGGEDQKENVNMFTGIKEEGRGKGPYVLSVVLVLTVFATVFLNSALLYAREMESATIRRMAALGAGRVEVYAGYSLIFILMSLVEAALLVLFSMVLNHDMGPSSPAMFGRLLLIAALAGLAAQNTGLLLATILAREVEIIQAVLLVFIPAFLLGGTILPVEGIAWPWRWLAYIDPISYAMFACIDVLSRNLSLAQTGAGAIGLVVYLAITTPLVLLATSFKRKN